MPKRVPPEKWQRYHHLLSIGVPLTSAAREAGISRKAALAFRRGDPTSSGVQWWLSVTPKTCPSCGEELPDASPVPEQRRVGERELMPQIPRVPVQ